MPELKRRAAAIAIAAIVAFSIIVAGAITGATP